MGFFFDLLHREKSGTQTILDDDGKDIGEYETNTKSIKEEKKEKPLTCGQKILLWMYNVPKKWKISDFQHSPFFIGYKANTRLWELLNIGHVERIENDGRFAQYQITESGMKFVEDFILKT